MKLFTIAGVDDAQIHHSARSHRSRHNPFDLSIQGDHTWSLPSIFCPSCGGYSGSLVLPCVDLTDFPRQAELRQVRCTDAENYQALSLEVAKFIHRRQGMMIDPVPGARFGPFVGVAFGSHWGDFVFCGTDLFVRESVESRLRSAGIMGLEAARPVLRLKGIAKPGPNLVELQLMPRLTLVLEKVQGLDTERCDDCGHSGASLLDYAGLSIRAEDIPGEADIFRAENAHEFIVVTERFYDVALSMGFSNITFQELPVMRRTAHL